MTCRCGIRRETCWRCGWAARWLALAFALPACGSLVCRDTYVQEDHGEQPYVLVRKCIVCRDASKLPTSACHAGVDLPFGATLVQ